MRRDTRQDPAETAGLDLFPIIILACAVQREPAPRLMGLQAAVANAVAMLAAFRLSNRHLPRPAWPRMRGQ